MEESVSKPIDSMGRIVVPAEWRKNWGRKVVMVRLSDDLIIVKTLRKKGNLTNLIDAIEIPEVKDFADTHELRRTLHG